MPGRMEFDFKFSQPRTRAGQRPDGDSPFRILVMGDFSGRGQRGECDPQGLANRPVLTVDVDNFDQLLSRLAPSVYLQPRASVQAETLVEFRSLDDFHPDRLYRDLPIFRGLRETRARLLDPATFEQAAAQLRPANIAAEESREASAADKRTAAAENDANLLERLLGSSPAATPARASAQPSAIDALIRSAVAPHIVPNAPPFQAQYVASVDAAAAEQMRALLHDQGFQALESAWRGIRWLVSELELGEQVKLYVLDVTRAELAADVAASADVPERMALYRRLVDEPARGIGGERWSLLAGLYSFSRSSEDARVLGMLGALASQAGAPFLAAAEPSLLGCDSLLSTPDPRDWHPVDDESGHDWQALRSSAVAAWIGLALPRILLRLPYGAKTEPVDQIAFEEFTPDSSHESYLWGNPALACALLFGQSFLDRGWEMEPGDRLELGDLPAHIVETDGEKRMHACAELFLTERAGEAVIEHGLMPVMSFRNRNAVRVLRIQSLARPAMALAGPWR